MEFNALYDVVVIGGGIHGAGVAQACAANGYSVLLLEQNTIASATSQKSSKLIHGGLRYLETAQFSLVHECLTERRYLLNNAPHLVKMKPFFLPVYRNTVRRPLQLRLGLSLYSLLAGFRKQTGFRSVKKQEWNQLDGLTSAKLDTVLQYWDAQTDDRLLTQAVLNSAKTMGGDATENAEFISATLKNNEWCIKFQNNRQKNTHKHTQENIHEVKARTIVNASGPWVNDVLKRIKPNVAGMPVDLIQGAHIVLDKPTEKGIYYLESPADQRAIFVMPWYGQTLVGTTEKTFTGSPINVAPSQAEEQYLLATAAHYFPKFKNATIVKSFAGLRVLPGASALSQTDQGVKKVQGHAFSRPRETTIYADQSQTCYSIYGGKLTAYRATAARVVKQLKKVLPIRKKIADTRFLKLPE